MAKTTTTKKTAKATEVKTVAKLQEELTKLQLEHLESRKSHKQGELVNPHVLTVQRKNIARTHTAITVARNAEASTNLSTLKEEK
jgi:ribosomal protein L29